jgi:hypothetical protein
LAYFRNSTGVFIDHPQPAEHDVAEPCSVRPRGRRLGQIGAAQDEPPARASLRICCCAPADAAGADGSVIDGAWGMGRLGTPTIGADPAVRVFDLRV